MGGRRSNSGGGFAAAFIFIVLLGVVIEYFWWIVGTVAATGLLYALFVWLQRQDELQKEAAERAREREKDLKIRADRQHRWELIGDDRAVYGADGAAAMRRVTDDGTDDEDDDLPIATIARSPYELAVLRTGRAQQWHWALFASILLQRRESLASRLRDSALGFVPPTAVRIDSGTHLAQRIYSVLDQLLELMQQIEAFLSAPSFMRALDKGGVEPDAATIEHVANRLMDYHLRLLELSEEGRSFSASAAYTDVLRDCARVLHQPLEGFRVFIDEFVELVDAFPRLLAHAKGTIDVGAIVLELDTDYAVLDRLTTRLTELR
ncbi:hypothetical protein [Mycolicibacterium duvalii]|uniref:Uncharacterized protein n=1 Tax=Mycolicibacterium duvalii TaxID=39688 RepID=A0A7I7K3M4_9MYCO|nr:hypothetical protein [Mycolicibacterium duvalii]MCV7367747.1 hypothetical protein [Mycolicibacterium duvalii]BBX18663.1 hypothetical protein MDUV_35230 [Mycolicibacterium duvalii]